MTVDAKLNVVLAQSHAIKEIYNAKKQSLELQQQLSSRLSAEQAARNRDRVLRHEDSGRVEERPDEEKKHQPENERGGRHGRKAAETAAQTPNDGILDIRV